MFPGSSTETTNHRVKDFRSSSYHEASTTQHSHNPGLDSWTPISAVASQSSTSSENSNPSTLTQSSSSSMALDSPASSVGSENQAADQTVVEGLKLSTTIDACVLSTSKHQHSTARLTRATTSVYDQFSTQTTSSSPETAIATSPGSEAYVTFAPLDDDKAYCDMCSPPRSFSGSRQHRESNLKRHMNDIHQQGVRLCCPESGCSKRCGRADNMRSHLLKMHGIDPPRLRPSNSTRHKKAAKRRNRTSPVSDTI